MKEFKVKATDSKDGASVKIKAENASEAYKKFLETQGRPNCPVLVELGGMFGYKTEFKEHLDEVLNKSIDEFQKKKNEEEAEAKKKYILRLSEQIKENGFSALNQKEVNFLRGLLDKAFIDQSLSDEEFHLTKLTLSDDSAYRFFSLRSQSKSAIQQQALLEAMNVNLSSISDKTSGIKMTSLYAAYAHSRDVADDMREEREEENDFGGEE